jgi:hypothetical protein
MIQPRGCPCVIIAKIVPAHKPETKTEQKDCDR